MCVLMTSYMFLYSVFVCCDLYKLHKVTNSTDGPGHPVHLVSQRHPCPWICCVTHLFVQNLCCTVRTDNLKSFLCSSVNTMFQYYPSSYIYSYVVALVMCHEEMFHVLIWAFLLYLLQLLNYKLLNT